MKELWLASLLIGFFGGTIVAANIKVTSPGSGDQWGIGFSKDVTWTYQGIPDGTLVTLKLFRGDEFQGVLASSVSIGSNGSGSWSWAKVGEFVGGKVPSGGDYHIRVRDTNGQYPRGSSASFAIYDATLKIKTGPPVSHRPRYRGDIKVSRPEAFLKLMGGQKVPIQWDKDAIPGYANVMLAIYRDDGKTYVGRAADNGVSHAPNTGSFNGAHVLMDKYQVGKSYVIRVNTPDEKHEGFSGVFQVVPPKKVLVTKTFDSSRTVQHVVEETKYSVIFADGIGSKPVEVPVGLCMVGWWNRFLDPAGPGYAYRGTIMRTIVYPPDLFQGTEVTRAELRFTVQQGVQQTFFLHTRDTNSDDRDAPLTLVSALHWAFGKEVVVDVTAAVQARCAGKQNFHGWLIKGNREDFAHDNTKALCTISRPQVVVSYYDYVYQ